MFFDKIDNYKEYADEYPLFEKIYEFIEADKKDPKPDGSYEIDGRNLFVNVTSYRSDKNKPLLFEAHRKYADLHYIVSGIEKIGWSPLGDVENGLVKEEYSSGGDAAFYEGKSKFDFILTKGSFLYVAPDDAHAPCLCAEKEMNVRKMIFKIKL